MVGSTMLEGKEVQVKCWKRGEMIDMMLMFIPNA